MKNKNDFKIIKPKGEEKKMETKMRNRSKLPILLGVFLLLLFGLVSQVMASASLTLNTVTWNKQTKVNITTKSANDGSLVNITNISIAFSASNTANSTSSFVINISNSTATNFDFGYANFTFDDSILLIDTRVGSVTGRTFGVGDSNGVALSATTVTIDRTKPVANGVTPIGTGLKTSTSTVTFGVINATSWQLFKNSVEVANGLVTGRFTNATVTQDFITGTSGNYFVRVSDGTNTTDSSTFTYTQTASTKVDEKRVQERKEEITKKPSINKKALMFLTAMSLFLVIIVIIVLVSGIGKKRR